MTEDQRRCNRDAQAKHRAKNGQPRQRSFANEIEDLRKQVDRLEICLAWESAQITEGQAAKMMGVDRVEARQIKGEATARGAGFESWNEMCHEMCEVPHLLTGYLGNISGPGGDPDTI